MSESVFRVKDTSANPAPLGLLGFGMTTVLLNLHNAGLYPLNSMILGMGIFVGGLAQVIAGVLESKKNNTFGMTAFSAYGFFWFSLVAIWILPALGLAEKASPFAMGCYLLIWGLFTFAMFFGSLKLTLAHRIIFASLTLLFVLLAAGDFTGSPVLKTLAGIEGLFCGLAAFYTAVALVLNEVYGRSVLPVGAKKVDPHSFPGAIGPLGAGRGKNIDNSYHFGGVETDLAGKSG